MHSFKPPIFRTDILSSQYRYGVTTLAESFDYQGATCLPMGRPDEKQALAGSGGGNIHES